MASTDEEPRATEQRADAPNEDQPAAEGLPVRIGYVFAAIGLIGLCVGAVVAVLADTSHVSTGGTIAAISAGLLAATLALGLLVVFHRKPADETKPKDGSADSRSGKTRTSRPASAKRPVPRTAARS